MRSRSRKHRRCIHGYNMGKQAASGIHAENSGATCLRKRRHSNTKLREDVQKKWTALASQRYLLTLTLTYVTSAKNSKIA